VGSTKLLALSLLLWHFVELIGLLTSVLLLLVLTSLWLLIAMYVLALR
jgi:hypothetical protein